MKKLMKLSEYAEHRRVSRPYISKLRARGVLIMRGPLVDVAGTDAVLDDKPVSATDAAGDPKTLTEARRIDTVLRAKLRRLELETKQRELIPASEVRTAWSRVITNTKNRLLLLPSRLAPRLAVITDPLECQEAIRIELYKALSELAEHGDSGLS